MGIDMKQSDDFPSQACAATARLTNAVLELQEATREVEALGFDVVYWAIAAGTSNEQRVRDVKIGCRTRVRRDGST